MKTVLLIALLTSASSFAHAGNSDVGSSTSSWNCTSTRNSLEKVKLQIRTDFSKNGDYTRPASINVEGLHDSFMNVQTDSAFLMANENAPMVVVPLQFKGDGTLVFVITDLKNKRGSLQHRNVEDKYTVLAEIVCK